MGHKQKIPAMTIWHSLAQSRGILRGPWTAALPTFAGTSVFYGIKFMTFEEVLKGINFLSEERDWHIPMDVKNATAGLFSGILGTSVTYPNNCIRKRMQTAHVCQALGIQSGYTAE